MYNCTHSIIRLMTMKQKVGRKTPDELTGVAIRRNVLLDKPTLDYYRAVGNNNISAGIRIVAKKLLDDQKEALG